MPTDNQFRHNFNRNNYRKRIKLTDKTPTVYEATQTGISIYKYFEKVLEDNNDITDIRFKAFQDLLKQRFELQDRAQTLANKNMEMRLEKLNELRSEVLQDRANYVTQDRCLTKHESSNKQYETIEDRVKRLELWQSKVYGAATVIGLIAGIVGGIISKIL